MRIAPHPPHRSGHEELPAPTSGNNVYEGWPPPAPHVLRPRIGHVCSGTESGPCFAATSSPWSGPFPPSPPPPVARRCSRTSAVVWACPTSRVRSSSAFVHRLPDASRAIGSGKPGISRFPCNARPYVPGSSTARAPQPLALAVLRVLPSAFCQNVGVSKFSLSRLIFPARTCPCQRFSQALAGLAA